MALWRYHLSPVTERQILPCPFCGRTWIDYFVTRTKDRESWPMAFRECRECRAQGPSAKNLKEATQLWNLRKR